MLLDVLSIAFEYNDVIIVSVGLWQLDELIGMRIEQYCKSGTCRC